jgi:hypothetical protein
MKGQSSTKWDIEHAEARYRAGLNALRQADFAAGWPLYEARKAVLGSSVQYPVSSAPEWLGEDLQGKRLVVCAEQGFGDQIMFGRFLPLLLERGIEVEVVCHPAIGNLFWRAGFSWKLFYRDKPIPDCDAWAMMGSIPHLLGNIIPSRPDFLGGNWMGGKGIGVCALGNPDHWNDAARSLPADAAESLMRIGRNIHPMATGFYEFTQTADLIIELDLVVTVDTSIAHLAGALGVPCWVLLPATGVDWRWNDGNRSAWYPDFTLFRNKSPENWLNTVREVISRIEQL